MKGMVKAGGAALALLLYMYKNAFAHNLRRQAVRLDAEVQFRPFNLLFIADIHRRKLSPEMLEVPVDIVVIGGDLAERGVSLKQVAENLKLLVNKAPVYFVWGNNDREVKARNLRKLFAHYGIKPMDNESVSLFGNPHLKLVGVNYLALENDGLDRAFSEVKKEDTVIFVSHSPFIFKRVKKKYPVDFLMAGHTHGGQIRLGKLGIYRKGALKIKGGKPELVTNGFGTTSLPLRLGAPAEYHLLTIQPKRRDWRNS
ncbi:putative MPP superfamily phosphohydrolase [Planomicrobium soli]|uniref:Putative MPP superfamily phosphohydrolase n=1 Tax=Planomicrobium soli TaxID=1176648 RepID=A0A2P8H735_9BACL|nr:metallophosphoesterase [Planomicrobium soli]PSL41994.1 putative MPP superfamily phosphohydrolase [Planomicrobium soli]